MVLLGLRSVQQYTLFIVLTRLANLPKSGGSKYGQRSVSVRGGPCDGILIVILWISRDVSCIWAWPCR